MSTAAKRGLKQWMCRAPRWALPVFSLVLGLVLAGALWISDQPGSWFVIGLFTAYAVFLYAFSPRSEVIARRTGRSATSGSARSTRRPRRSPATP